MQPKYNLTFLFNIVFNIILPTIILIKGPQYFPSEYILIILSALLFPIVYGAYSWLVYNEKNVLSVLGLLGTLITGIIAIIKLPKEWVAFKEAFIPFILSILVYSLRSTRYSVFNLFIYNENVLNIRAIKDVTENTVQQKAILQLLLHGNLALAASFLLSSVLNFSLAKILIKSPTGTAAFVKELGQLNALSYIVIAIPCALICIITFIYFFKKLEKLTGLSEKQLFK